MMKTAATAACCAAATAAALAAVLPSLAQEPERPPTAHVTVRGLTASAAGGSYCIPASDASQDEPIAPGDVCVDAAYPLRPKGRLPVRSRSRARIDVRTRARSLRAQLVRVRGRRFSFIGRSFNGRVLTEDGRHWKVRLPSRLGDANALSIDVGYPDGHANFWAGLRDLDDD